MATEEYKGPDISFVEAQEKAAYELRVNYYKDSANVKKQIDIKLEHELSAMRLAEVELENAKAIKLRKNASEKEKANKAAAIKKAYSAYEAAQKAYDDSFIKEQQRISKIRFDNEYKTWTVSQRRQFEEQKINQLKKLQEQTNADIAYYKAVGELTKEQQADFDKKQQQAIDLNKQIVAATQEATNYTRALQNAETHTERLTRLTEERKNLQEQISKLSKEKSAAIELGLDTSSLDEQLEKLTAELAENTSAAKASKKGAAKEKIQKEVSDRKEHAEEAKDDARAEIAARFGTSEGRKNEAMKAASAAMAKAAEAINAGLNQINSKIDSFYSLQAKMEARLQGATLDGKQLEYSRMLKNISQSIGLSGLVRQDKVVEKLQTLVDQGVAYNAESRAFLGTIAENVASTFDATNPDLLRLIRLQQADTTAARLGLEASLTRLFNQYFSDTSYLAQAFDSVSASLIDVSSMLSRDDSLAFEYNVQKWLGALSSLGLSDSAATTISQGLNYLGTGNVTALNSSSTLQTLFAMSAGSSYADILTKGLNANSTNDLLRNMIIYLKSIADNTNENLVVKSAYAELLGVSVSDLSAIANITQTEIDNLHKKTLTYEQAYKETQDQLNKVSSRIHFSQMVSNSIDNALTTSATGIGGTPALYGMWKTASIIEDLTGGIAIPFINAMGFGVDLNTTVMGLLKTGIAGGSLLGQLIGSLANGRAGGAMNLDSWKIQSYTSRGNSRKALDIGAMTGVSQSGSFDFAGSSSGSDISNSSMAGAAEDAEETGKITNKSQEGKADFIEKIYKAIGEDKSSNIIDLLGSINNEVKSISSSSSGPILSRLVSASSFATDLSSIRETYFSTVGADISNNNQAGLGVVVNGLSADTKAYFDHTIKALLATMLAGETTVDGSLETGGLVEAIKTAMSSVTMPVRVTNDYFDENQQRQAFGGIS